jgi:uncharacterized protein (DUF3820 family)
MTDSEKAKRVEKARRGRWAVARQADNAYQVCNLDNGGHTYTVTTADGDEYACTCKDFAHRGGPCKHSEAIRLLQEGESLNVQPVIETGEDGVTATYLDGARISLTIGGRTACSRCGERPCHHYHEAVPFYGRWKWQQAQSGRWPARRLVELGIPPIAAKPGLLGKKRWTPPVTKIDGAKLYAVAKGHVVHFPDGGHVYVGASHPDGHTPCLGSDDGCKNGACDHVVRAIHLRSSIEGSEEQGRTLLDRASTSSLAQDINRGDAVLSSDLASDDIDITTFTTSEVNMTHEYNWAEVQRELAEPFPAGDVSWKAQATNKDKTRALAVAYVDARDVMDRLDEVVGPQGWSDTYRVVVVAGESAVECTLTVLGVSKTDVGTPGDSSDKAKGAYSDAFKRAAVRFGIGRYLYRLPKAWVDYDSRRKQLVETPALPGWALPDAERAQKRAPARTTPASAASGDNGNKGNGHMSLKEARAFVMPFGTRNHPEYKGRALGSLPSDLISWLAGDQFQPDTGPGQRVKVAAEALAGASA